MRIIKASRDQRYSYRGGNSLFGFVHICHSDCAIELIGRGTDLEGVVLRAPAEHRFMPANVPAIMFDSIEKLREHLNGTEIRLLPSKTSHSNGAHYLRVFALLNFPS
jgi:hypothetical protein